MKRKSIGIGLVSYGYMGKVHSLCYQELPFYYDLQAPVKLIGIADPSESSRERALREAQFEFATAYPEDLLVRSDIDVIDICSPTYLHEQYVVMAAEAGKAIYTEKPLGHTLDSARRAYTAVSTNGVHTGMAFEYRFVPALLEAKNLLKQGTIGSVINFRVAYQGPEHLSITKFTWQLDKEKAGGGVLFALGSHTIDLIRFLIGEFDSVSAIGKSLAAKGDVEQLVLIQARMQSGAVGSIEVSQVAVGSGIDVRVEIYGTEGTICFDNRYPNILRLCEMTKKSVGFQEIQTMQRLPDAVFPPPRVDVNWLRYHLAAQYQFIKGLDKEINLVAPTIYDGLKCQEVIEAVLRSWDSGSWVCLAEI